MSFTFSEDVLIDQWAYYILIDLLTGRIYKVKKIDCTYAMCGGKSSQIAKMKIKTDMCMI